MSQRHQAAVHAKFIQRVFDAFQVFWRGATTVQPPVLNAENELGFLSEQPEQHLRGDHFQVTQVCFDGLHAEVVADGLQNDALLQAVGRQGPDGEGLEVLGAKRGPLNKQDYFLRVTMSPSSQSAAESFFRNSGQAAGGKLLCG